MEKLTCKTCGTHSMIPMEVAIVEEKSDQFSSLFDQDPESCFYTCHVCGDNWLSVIETEDTGVYRITFVHQMGMIPVLKRIAHMQHKMVVDEDSVEYWTYFLDDQQIDEEVWFDKLSDRRKILKSICTN